MLGFLFIRRNLIFIALCVLGNSFVSTSLAYNIPPQDIRSIQQEIAVCISPWAPQPSWLEARLSILTKALGTLYYLYPRIQNYPIIRRPGLKRLVRGLWDFYPIHWWMGSEEQDFYCSTMGHGWEKIFHRQCLYLLMGLGYITLKVKDIKVLKKKWHTIQANKNILFRYLIYSYINQQFWAWMLSRISSRAGHWLAQLPIQITYILLPNLPTTDVGSITFLFVADLGQIGENITKLAAAYAGSWPDMTSKLPPAQLVTLTKGSWEMVQELHLTFYKKCTVFYKEVKSIEFVNKFLDQEKSYPKVYGFALLPQSWAKLPNRLFLGGTLGAWVTAKGIVRPIVVLLGGYRSHKNINVYFRLGYSTHKYVKPDYVLDFGISYIFL